MIRINTYDVRHAGKSRYGSNYGRNDAAAWERRKRGVALDGINERLFHSICMLDIIAGLYIHRALLWALIARLIRPVNGPPQGEDIIA